VLIENVEDLRQFLRDEISAIAKASHGTDDLLTETEAAGFLRKRPKTLANWRTQNKGPKYIYDGKILYKYGDLLEFVEQKTINPNGTGNEKQN